MGPGNVFSAWGDLACLPIDRTHRPTFNGEQGGKGCSEVSGSSRVAGIRGEILRRLETLGVLPKASSRTGQWPETGTKTRLETSVGIENMRVNMNLLSICLSPEVTDLPLCP